MEQMEQNDQRKAYWSGLLSGLLLAILLIGVIFVGKQVFRIFEAKKKREPHSDSLKNQVLTNYFTEEYMKYLNPSGLAKKPSILSLHIKISV